VKKVAHACCRAFKGSHYHENLLTLPWGGVLPQLRTTGIEPLKDQHCVFSESSSLVSDSISDFRKVDQLVLTFDQLVFTSTGSWWHWVQEEFIEQLYRSGKRSTKHLTDNEVAWLETGSKPSFLWCT